jgi:hypothetical protein
MRISKFATALQIFENILERQAGLTRTSFEGLEIFVVFGECLSNRCVDEIREALVGLSSLETQRSMEGGIKVDGGALGFRSHDRKLTL